MAIASSDIPISRADVAGWINEWKKRPLSDATTLEDFIRQQIDDLDLPDRMVVTSGEGLNWVGSETDIADVIIEDLPSYGAKHAPGS